VAETTEIGWTDATFSPWWGCAHVSPGCASCYAERLAARWGHDVWGKLGARRLFGDDHWRKPLAWNRKAEREDRRLRVFCASMADVFEDHPALPGERAKLWPLIEQTPRLDWQILTKRPEFVASMVPPSWLEAWPAHAWIGTSVEDQRRADERVPELIRIPAALRFLSVEPLVGSVSLRPEWLRLGRVSWVIVGGESGPEYRPMDVEWLRNVAAQVWQRGIPLFVKQAAGRWPGTQGDIPSNWWQFKQIPGGRQGPR
jgi:protein gp37